MRLEALHGAMSVQDSSPCIARLSAGRRLAPERPTGDGRGAGERRCSLAVAGEGAGRQGISSSCANSYWAERQGTPSNRTRLLRADLAHTQQGTLAYRASAPEAQVGCQSAQRPRQHLFVGAAARGSALAPPGRRATRSTGDAADRRRGRRRRLHSGGAVVGSHQRGWNCLWRVRILAPAASKTQAFQSRPSPTGDVDDDDSWRSTSSTSYL